MRSSDWLLLALCVSAACAPTLSKPRGTKHLSALAEAERHQFHGRLDQAAASYEQAAVSAERRVDRDEALYRASRVRARQGSFEQAIALCDRIAEAKPPSRRTLRATLDAARYRIALGQSYQTERAASDLRTIVVKHPDSGEAKSALRVLLGLRVSSAEPAQALAFVQTLAHEVKAGFAAESLMYEESALLIALDRKPEARTLLEAQVKRFPYPQGGLWDDGLWRLADLAEQAGDPRAAVAYLEQMIAVHETAHLIGTYTRPRFSQAALRIARIYRDDIADLDAAVRAFRHTRNEFPTSLVVDDALEEEAEIWLSRGNKSQGCALLKQLLAQHEVGAARRKASARLAADCQ